MILAFRFLVPAGTTTSVNEHAIHPYAYWSMFRPVRFPDVVPCLSDWLKAIFSTFPLQSRQPSLLRLGENRRHRKVASSLTLRKTY